MYTALIGHWKSKMSTLWDSSFNVFNFESANLAIVAAWLCGGQLRNIVCAHSGYVVFYKGVVQFSINHSGWVRERQHQILLGKHCSSQQWGDKLCLHFLNYNSSAWLERRPCNMTANGGIEVWRWRRIRVLAMAHGMVQHLPRNLKVDWQQSHPKPRGNQSRTKAF